MHGKCFRIFCHDCKKKISINHKEEKSNELLKNHLNRNSYRILEGETGVSKKAVCKKVNAVTEKLIDSNELTKILQPQNYCGILLMDGKYCPVKDVTGKSFGFVPCSAKRRGKTKGGLVTITCMDYLTHDTPVHGIFLSENIFDIDQVFQKLKDIGYPLKVLVCDESMGKIAERAKVFFPNVKIQICLTHYSKTIERCFLANAAKRTYRALQKKLHFLDESFFISTHHRDIEKAVSLTNRMAELEHEYFYLWRVQELFHELFWKVKTKEELIKWEDIFNEQIGAMNLKNYKHAQKIKDRYLDYYEKRESIISCIFHPEIPRTTNLIEGFHSTTLEIRFSSIRGFKKEEYAQNYINALILKYRFHKFTDCKKKFKNLNGKSPLQIANPLNTFGFNFQRYDWLSFCQKFKKEPPK